MSTSTLAHTAESTALLERAQQLESCILRLENARYVSGALSPIMQNCLISALGSILL